MSFRYQKLDTDNEDSENEKVDKETETPTVISMTASVKQDIRTLLSLAWPLMIVNMLRYMNPLISILICGRLSKTEFDGASLANSFISVFGITIDTGFSTACDTLFSQTYGSKYRKRMGYILQRAMCVMTIVYIILISFHLNIRPLLTLMEQDYTIIGVCTNYVKLYMPGLFFDFQFLTLTRYLQNQNIVLPIMLSTFCGFLFNAISQFVAIRVLGARYQASAILQGSTNFVMFLCLLCYIIGSKVYKPTWPGFSITEALKQWKIFFVLGIPGIIMLGIENWAYEAMSFISGFLSKDQLGGQTIGFQVELIAITFNTAIGVALLILVGQKLTSHDVESAKRTIKITYILSLSIAVTFGSIIALFREYICLLFTDDKVIQMYGSKILLWVAIFQPFDALCIIPGSILRACGRQMIGAIIMSACYFMLGIPLGIVLVFYFGFDISGMWLSLFCGFLVETTIYNWLVYKTNWKLQSENASKMTVAMLSNPTDLNKSYESDLLISKHSRKPSLVEIEFEKKPENIKNLVKWRLIQMSCVLLFLLAAILLSVLLPQRIYTPCVEIQSSRNDSSWLNWQSRLVEKEYPKCQNSSVIG